LYLESKPETFEGDGCIRDESNKSRSLEADPRRQLGAAKLSHGPVRVLHGQDRHRVVAAAASWDSGFEFSQVRAEQKIVGSNPTKVYVLYEFIHCNAVL
jgi:hypothetical protein